MRGTKCRRKEVGGPPFRLLRFGPLLRAPPRGFHQPARIPSHQPREKNSNLLLPTSLGLKVGISRKVSDFVGRPTRAVRFFQVCKGFRRKATHLGEAVAEPGATASARLGATCLRRFESRRSATGPPSPRADPLAGPGFGSSPSGHGPGPVLRAPPFSLSAQCSRPPNLHQPLRRPAPLRTRALVDLPVTTPFHRSARTSPSRARQPRTLSQPLPILNLCRQDRLVTRRPDLPTARAPCPTASAPRSPGPAARLPLGGKARPACRPPAPRKRTRRACRSARPGWFFLGGNQT